MGNISWLKLRKKLKNWVIYKFIQFLIFFLNLFPRKVSLIFGASLGRLAYLILPEARQITLRNLKIAFSEKNSGSGQAPPLLKRLSLMVFESLGRNVADAVRLPKMRWARVKDIVETEGMEHFDKAYSLGKGVMAVTGHIGNFEFLAAYFSRQGYKVSVIGRELYDPRLNRLLVQNRERMGVQNISTSAGLKEIIKALNSGRALGVLMDQDTSRVRGIFVNFFGRKARTAVGPVILALKTGSPIVPMAIVQKRNGNYKIIIKEEIKPFSEKERDENILYLTEECTAFLEEVIRKYPDQWTWMHKRWRTPPDNP